MPLQDQTEIILKAIDKLDDHINSKIDMLAKKIDQIDAKSDATSNLVAGHQVEIVNIKGILREQKEHCKICNDLIHGKFRIRAEEMSAEMAETVKQAKRNGAMLIENQFLKFKISGIVLFLLVLIALMKGDIGILTKLF